MNPLLRQTFFSFRLITILTLVSPIALADIAIIVHPNNHSELDKISIARIFLGQSSMFSNGQQALPLNQNSTLAAATEFNQKVLNKSAARLKAYWSQLIFTGQGTPPVSVDSNAEVLALVEKNPNLIGYIDQTLVSDKVRVVATF
ncbi:phosphate ABC transporter substrate-binding protein [Alteromonadaceae bacterium BrNp21-10]|nr:phosphate ABC transporter substrate-binding protein [Alteromonadaceae bacterium BrNp21-10]